MKKSLLLFLLGSGLVWVTTGPALAQVDNLQLRSGTATLAFNESPSPGGPAGQVVPNGPVGGACPTAANYSSYGGASPATFNMGSATLAGAFTLVLLQRRYRQMLS